jgi:hypothetical protein
MNLLDRGGGNVAAVVCGCLKPFRDRPDFRWQRIPHEGGHHRFYLVQEALLGSVGCAHVL